jgi:ATPase subunit of ABC transporter with duplicated ATPase domains
MNRRTTSTSPPPKCWRTRSTISTGTVLVISHDRYFLDRTVNRIFELKDARIAEYTGGYSDYAENIERKKEKTP